MTTAPGHGETKPSGVELIAAERRRQIKKEDWTPEHDDKHRRGELALAAACYALGEIPKVARIFEDTSGRRSAGESGPMHVRSVPAWPWDPAWWKPKDRMANLVRAGALIAAEIDRLQRASKP